MELVLIKQLFSKFPTIPLFNTTTNNITINATPNQTLNISSMIIILLSSTIKG